MTEEEVNIELYHINKQIVDKSISYATDKLRQASKEVGRCNYDILSKELGLTVKELRAIAISPAKLTLRMMVKLAKSMNSSIYIELVDTSKHKVLY
ncbi:MAG: hypothetical protein WC444_05085 [Candidatus Paceibacterota bacterium]